MPFFAPRLLQQRALSASSVLAAHIFALYARFAQEAAPRRSAPTFHDVGRFSTIIDNNNSNIQKSTSKYRLCATLRNVSAWREIFTLINKHQPARHSIAHTECAPPKGNLLNHRSDAENRCAARLRTSCRRTWFYLEARKSAFIAHASRLPQPRRLTDSTMFISGVLCTRMYIYIQNAELNCSFSLTMLSANA